MIDLETVPNQLGTAILRLDTGALISNIMKTGQMNSSSGAETAQTLYHILLDTGLILKGKDESLRRIAVQFKTFQYVMTISKDEVYIVKKSADDTRG